MITQPRPIEQFVNQPTGTTILVANMNGYTWMVLPYSGNLWVDYEFQNEQVDVFIWHQGGTTDPVVPGPATYAVNATDCLVYQQPTDPSQSIKLGWAYT